MAIPTEIILHCLSFLSSADLCKLLCDTTDFREAPVVILRQRFRRLLSDPCVTICFESSLPSNYKTTVRQELTFSHIDDSCREFTAHFTFSPSTRPFTFSLESDEAFQTVMLCVSLRSAIAGRRLNYATTLVEGIERFFKASFSSTPRATKHAIPHAPTPPCTLHTLHLPPEPSNLAIHQPVQLSSSLPSHFPYIGQVTNYSVQYTALEVSIALLLTLQEKEEMKGGYTVFYLGR